MIINGPLFETLFSVVIVCCCFRFRIPRTKQQIEADYQRRKITSKFRQKLETIQDAEMDTMSLKDGHLILLIHILYDSKFPICPFFLQFPNEVNCF